LRFLQLAGTPLHVQSQSEYLCCNCEVNFAHATGESIMRSIAKYVLPVIMAASVSGLMFTAALI